MSNRAMLWAFEQKGLKPATKLILVFLADCHNGKTRRCDPNQGTIADRCNVSRATVNRHLDELEARGLIQRIRRANKLTKKQDSTLYRLGCDGPFQPLKDRKSGDATAGIAVSQNETREKAKPCLNSETRESESRVSKTGKAVSQKRAKPCLNSETQTGKEPEKNLSRAQAQASERTHAHGRTPAREVMFFTHDERHTAEQIAKAVKDGWRIFPEHVPDRVAACLWVEGHLSPDALRSVGIAEKGGCNG